MTDETNPWAEMAKRRDSLWRNLRDVIGMYLIYRGSRIATPEANRLIFNDHAIRE